jgi:pyruvate kinase
MLSGESAMGRYPVDAVEMLARIAAEVEPQRRMISVRELYQGIEIRSRVKPAHLIAIAVEAALEHASPAAVFAPTHSGATARRLSLFRLPVWIIGISSNEATCQGMLFSSGVHPVHNEDHPLDYSPFVRAWLREHGLEGDIAVLAEGPSVKHPGTNHRMEIIELRNAGREG